MLNGEDAARDAIAAPDENSVVEYLSRLVYDPEAGICPFEECEEDGVAREAFQICRQLVSQICSAEWPFDISQLGSLLTLDVHS